VTNEELELLRAIFDLSSGKGVLVPFDEIAIRLEASVTVTRMLAALLGSRKLAIVTFGGVQLTAAGLEQAKLQHAE
jgi:Mn-dependent DtxR family transcriptional regulator